MKTRDTDYLYATMRIRALERNLLDEERIDRMMEAKTFEDMVKVLAELGYAEMPNAAPHEVEQALAHARQDAFSLLSDLSPQEAIVDVFRIRYDYHNIKAILKGEAAGVDPQSLLIDAGRYPLHSLRTIMRQMEYRDLTPPLRAAVEQARETLARTNDPQLADFVLDQAYFAEISEAAKASNNRFLQKYVSLMIDIANLRALVRALRQKKGAEFLRNALFSGGSVDVSRFLQATSGDTTVRDLFAGTALEAAAEAGALAISGEAGFTRFERLCDNALISYLQSARYVAFGDAPLAAFLAAKEADIAAIRIIMAGKLQNLPADEIRERLRASYV